MQGQYFTATTAGLVNDFQKSDQTPFHGNLSKTHMAFTDLHDSVSGLCVYNSMTYKLISKKKCITVTKSFHIKTYLYSFGMTTLLFIPD